jgi:hypothetical protein
LLDLETPFGAPAGENPPVPPDTQEGPGEVGPGETGPDPAPDPSEDAPGEDEGHPESPAKGTLTYG